MTSLLSPCSPLPGQCLPVEAPNLRPAERGDVGTGCRGEPPGTEQGRQWARLVLYKWKPVWTITKYFAVNMFYFLLILEGVILVNFEKYCKYRKMYISH